MGFVEPTLWAHQEEGVRRALPLPGFAWFYEPGSGKTLTAITTLRRLFTQERRAMRTLILCPQIVIDNWGDEIERFSKMGPMVCLLKGKKTDRIKALDHPGKKLFVTNFESLDMEGLFWEYQGKVKKARRLGIEVLIIDESHRLKNPSAARTKMAIKLRDAWPLQKVLLLSGTPVLNTLMDVWAQWRLLDGGQDLGRSFTFFRGEYFENKNASAPSYVTWPEWVPKRGTKEKIAAFMGRRSMDVKKRDCVDLPPLVKQIVTAELSKEQMQDYQTMEKEMVVELRSGVLTAPIAATKLLRLQQIVSGAFETSAGVIHQYKDTPRMRVLQSLVEDLSSEQIIVWTPWAATYKMITKQLLDQGRSVGLITGRQTAKEKASVVAEFRAGRLDTVVANPAAAGTGVNLTEASVALWYARSFSLEHRLQGEARNYRGGSTMHSKVLQIDVVTPNTVDSQILDSLGRKEDLGQNLLSWMRRVYG